jgi:hypothetical protein
VVAVPIASETKIKIKNKKQKKKTSNKTVNRCHQVLEERTNFNMIFKIKHRTHTSYYNGYNGSQKKKKGQHLMHLMMAKYGKTCWVLGVLNKDIQLKTIENLKF